MAISTEWIRYGAERHVGYLGWPEGARAPMPSVVVLQEAWGVDEHIQDVTRRFAGAGYVALAPDLYARDGERPEPLSRERLQALRAFVDELPRGGLRNPTVRDAALAERPEPERAELTESLGAMMGELSRLPSFVPQLRATTHFLREQHALSRGGKVGSVGFCMGGGLSALLACHDPSLGAAVIFYGSSPAAELVPGIRCPVLGLYGGLDAGVNAQVPAFEEAMKLAGKRFERVEYEGAEHAFFNDGRPAYDARASRDAFVRTLELLRAELA